MSAQMTLSDLEIAVLCDLLDGPGANLKVHKRDVLDQLVTKGLVRVVVRYLDEHSELKMEEFRSAALEALEKAWPCK
jgi:hypothetical protein